MITLLVNYYAEDPMPAIASAHEHLGYLVDRVALLHGRYSGFPELEPDRPGGVFPTEHAKRNALLDLAGPASAYRFLMILDADERVVQAAPLPQLEAMLFRCESDVIETPYIELRPDGSRRVGDKRLLWRHLAGLHFAHRHDFLLDGDDRLLVGWPDEPRVELTEAVPIAVEHLIGTQSEERKLAKEKFYYGELRQNECRRFAGPLAERSA